MRPPETGDSREAVAVGRERRLCIGASLEAEARAGEHTVQGGSKRRAGVVDRAGGSTVLSWRPVREWFRPPY